MKLRSGALGIAIAMAAAAFVAGCGSSGGTKGTGGTSGGTGGKTDGGTTTDGGTGGRGTGGTTVTDGGTDTPADAPAPTDASDASAPPRCGPFADGGMPSDASILDASAMASFFVTSNTSATANLGGLAGADTRCQTLANAAGIGGGRIWHAYLSVEHGTSVDAGTGPINAKDRIGAGPWYNVNGALIAANVAALHARTGDPSLFVDEHGALINGQWTGSPTPNQHDILTGSNPDGTVFPGKTCDDWTSAAAVPDGGVPDGGLPDGGGFAVARVGHTDGYGPMCATGTTNTGVASWNSAHDNRGCNDTAPAGGAGRLYCFAVVGGSTD